MTSRPAIPRVLSIAGTDPTGGAGIHADLKSIAANGGYAMAVVTALVAQNTQGVRSVHVPPVSFLAEQLDAVSDDVEIDAVKIGMLANVDVIATVGAWLDRARPPLVVLDPVMVATSGDRLLDTRAEQALRDLAARADLITPNIAELAVLAEQPLARTWDAVLAQARDVAESTGVLVLAKGGHLAGTSVPDALVPSDCDAPVVQFDGPRVLSTNTHGTGCSLSSAVATRYARSGSWSEATAESKRWLAESIGHGADLGVGSGPGPISHLAGLWARGGTETAPTPEQVRDAWWDQTSVIRAAIDDLDFVRRLGDGTLSPEAFGWYLAQDALYLRDYARVLTEASGLAPTLEEQEFWAGGAYRTLRTELRLHEARARDVEPPRASEVTTAYLDHLLATAARGDYRVLIAAVLPCYWLYADLGHRLRTLARDDHPYRDWLLTYDDPGFADATARAIALVTRHAADADPATREAMRRAFLASAEHEWRFFDAPQT